MDSIFKILNENFENIGKVILSIPLILFNTIFLLIIFLIRFAIWVKIKNDKIKDRKNRKQVLNAIIGRCTVEFIIAITFCFLLVSIINNPKNIFINNIISPLLGFIFSLEIYIKLFSEQFLKNTEPTTVNNKETDKTKKEQIVQPITQININTTKDETNIINEKQDENDNDKNIDKLKNSIESNELIQDREIEYSPKINAELFKEKINNMITNEKMIAEVLENHSKKIDELEKTNKEEINLLHEITKRLDDMKNENLKDKAIQSRIRILRFNDEILSKVNHSKESFDQCLTDIDIYDDYCKNHPNFKNSMTVYAEENIRNVYKECMEKKSFLV